MFKIMYFVIFSILLTQDYSLKFDGIDDYVEVSDVEYLEKYKTTIKFNTIP